MEIVQCGKNLLLKQVENFSLADTLDCGQAFRWKEKDGVWSAVAGGKNRALSQVGDEITIYNCDSSEYENFYAEYFDMGRNYADVVAAVSQNKVLKEASEIAGGIRILKQEPWETLVSFIISQNNNIPRIKGIIDRLCENFGTQTDGGYTFPSAERLYALSAEDLAPIRSGFRAKYILDAARCVSEGIVDFKKVESRSTDEARCELMKIKGVGAKVADCTLLFSFARIDAFPKDVWIKRAMEVLFDGELPECAREYAGIAQQYIFHYARITKLNV